MQISVSARRYMTSAAKMLGNGLIYRGCHDEGKFTENIYSQVYRSCEELKGIINRKKNKYLSPFQNRRKVGND